MHWILQHYIHISHYKSEKNFNVHFYYHYPKVKVSTYLKVYNFLDSRSLKLLFLINCAELTFE